MSNSQRPRNQKYRMNPKAAAYRDARRQASGAPGQSGEMQERRPVVKRRKKSSKAFKRALLIYTLSLMVILAGVCILLTVKLTDYQKEIDQENSEKEYLEEVRRAPQLYFENFADNLNVDELTNLWFSSHPEHYDSELSVKDIMQSRIIDVSPQRFRSSKSSTQTPIYVLKNGDELLAEFALKGAEKTWDIDSAEFFFEGSSREVTAPSDCDVFINGSLIDRGLISSEIKSGEGEKYAEFVENPVIYSTYLVPGVIGEVAFSVTGGRGYPLEENEESGFSYVLDAGEAVWFQDRASNFVRTLLKYYSFGSSNTEVNKNAVLSFIAPASQAYKVITESASGVTWKHPHTNVSYDLSTTSVTVEADNLRRVDVSYMKVGEPEEDVTTEGTYCVFFLDKGNGYNIYNFELR